MPKGNVYSVKAEKAVKLLASGKVTSQREAMLKSGYKQSTIDSHNPPQTKTWKALMERYLNDQAVTKAHNEALQAKNVITASKDGAITDTLETPDHKTRLKAVELAYKLKGRLNEANNQSTTNVQINAFSTDISKKITDIVSKELDNI